MGFRVDHDSGRHVEYPVGTIVSVQEHLHEKLDEVIVEMLKHGGAECQLHFASGPVGSEFVLRLTLCDFTGEELCEHCDGTGCKKGKTTDSSP